jgi:hypothetical protein
MKWFTITGRFQASDIDDALDFLADHFVATAVGDHSGIAERLSEFDVKPEPASDTEARNDG